MSNFTYFPIIKTRDAELKAMTHLKDDVFDKILPIYEPNQEKQKPLQMETYIDV